MSMKFKQAERLQKLPPYLFVRLEQLAAQKKAEGVKMIDFGIGDPALPCPGEIVRAMKKAADVNENQKYSSSKGEKDLREAIAEYYKKRFNVKVTSIVSAWLCVLTYRSPCAGDWHVVYEVSLCDETDACGISGAFSSWHCGTGTCIQIAEQTMEPDNLTLKFVDLYSYVYFV